MEQMSFEDLQSGPMTNAVKACRWAKEGYGRANGRWFILIDIIEDAIKRGERRVRRGDVYRMAQERGMTITQCEIFSWDNNMWSALSRYLLMFRPSLAAVIHPKKAAIDHIDLQRVWRDEVNPHTFFMADTWEQAVEAYKSGDVSAL